MTTAKQALATAPRFCALALLSLGPVACGGVAAPSPPGPPPGEAWCDLAHTHSCPLGQECLADGSCLIAGEIVGKPGTCDPVACQAWDDFATTGDGGACAGLCSSACVSTCAGDTESVAEDRAQAEAEGCDWTACRF